MTWPNIDPTVPTGGEKKKFGDDRIREAKQHTIDVMQAVSNYSAAGDTPALRTAVWTTATRPTGAGLVDRTTGYNTDLGGQEIYDNANSVWNPGIGLIEWSTITRPAHPLKGMIGYCTDLAVIERWTGSVWDRVSGGRRGDVKMWSGAIADIATKNPGWVLADGSSQTIDGATFTVPDLRNRFIVGAGADGGTHTAGSGDAGSGYYAPGATGGEDKHSLIEAENGIHNHSLSDVPAFLGNASGVVGFVNGSSSYGPWSNSWTTANSGSGTAHENRPPYYSLCFLFKL